MKKYSVTLLITGYHTIIINAENEANAVRIAQEYYFKRDTSFLDNVEISEWETVKVGEENENK